MVCKPFVLASLVCAIATGAIVGNHAVNAACAVKCDELTYFHDFNTAEQPNGKKYKISTGGTCIKLWVTSTPVDNWANTMAATPARKYKEVTAGNCVKPCLANGGVWAEVSSCTDEVLGTTEVPIDCFTACQANQP